MAARRVDGFFYGLFMDADVLGESQIVPERPRRARVDDFALRIGQRATLVPAVGARAYGMVYALHHTALDTLYTAPGLDDYRPEAVLARSVDGDGAWPALCFNLIEPPGPDEANADYAARLREILRRLEFPPEYVASIS